MNPPAAPVFPCMHVRHVCLTSSFPGRLRAEPPNRDTEWVIRACALAECAPSHSPQKHKPLKASSFVPKPKRPHDKHCFHRDSYWVTGWLMGEFNSCLLWSWKRWRICESKRTETTLEQTMFFNLKGLLLHLYKLNVCLLIMMTNSD